jgi:hypothetical protein
MRRLLEIGGIVAGVVLIAFGIGSLVLAAQGKSTVKHSLKQEKIVGSPDMTPDGIAAEAKQAGLSGVGGALRRPEPAAETAPAPATGG